MGGIISNTRGLIPEAKKSALRPEKGGFDTD
jgi:hypothetical protein